MRLIIANEVGYLPSHIQIVLLFETREISNINSVSRENPGDEIE